jgi:hypothetical protein
VSFDFHLPVILLTVCAYIYMHARTHTQRERESESLDMSDYRGGLDW